MKGRGGYRWRIFKDDVWDASELIGKKPIYTGRSKRWEDIDKDISEDLFNLLSEGKIWFSDNLWVDDCSDIYLSGDVGFILEKIRNRNFSGGTIL